MNASQASVAATKVQAPSIPERAPRTRQATKDPFTEPLMKESDRFPGYEYHRRQQVNPWPSLASSLSGALPQNTAGPKAQTERSSRPFFAVPIPVHWLHKRSSSRSEARASLSAVVSNTLVRAPHLSKQPSKSRKPFVTE